MSRWDEIFAHAGHNSMRALIEALDRQTAVFEKGFSDVVTALNALNPTFVGPAVEFQILIGGTFDMQKGQLLSALKAAGPVPITDLPTGQRIAVVGLDAQGALGATLPTGAKIAFTPVSDPTVAAITPDATAQPVNFVDSTGVQRNGIPTLLTGTLIATSPVNANVPATIGYAITNADGTAGDTGTASFDVVPGTVASEVLVFSAKAPAARR
jgi:hypothetical protein